MAFLNSMVNRRMKRLCLNRPTPSKNKDNPLKKIAGVFRIIEKNNEVLTPLKNRPKSAALCQRRRGFFATTAQTAGTPTRLSSWRAAQSIKVEPLFLGIKSKREHMDSNTVGHLTGSSGTTGLAPARAAEGLKQPRANTALTRLGVV